jgi:hypothetical protein
MLQRLHDFEEKIFLEYNDDLKMAERKQLVMLYFLNRGLEHATLDGFLDFLLDEPAE